MKTGQILFLLAACAGLLSWHPALESSIWRYTIQPESSLYIAGSSNVVDFTCQCPNQLPGGQLEILQEDNRTFFSNAVMKLPVKGMDCGNRMMNRDMYNTLLAEQHPHIRIALREAVPMQNSAFLTVNKWVPFTATVQLTVAGTTRTQTMPVQGIHRGAQRYQFKGQHTIRLTDFGISPPTALLGTVKVNDAMTIHMNLVLELGTD